MSTARKFAHGATYCHIKGKIRVQCSCGEISPLFEDIDDHPLNRGKEELSISKEEQAKDWYIEHTGLKEQNPTKRSSS